MDGKGKNFCCVIHDWVLRLVFPWISSTPPADFYTKGIQRKADFTMTITVTTSPSTVPKGKAMAEGNSRQWNPGRCYRKCGSAALRYIEDCLRADFYLPKLQYIDLHKARKVWLIKVIFFCLPETERIIPANTWCSRATKMYGILQVIHKWLRCKF